MESATKVCHWCVRELPLAKFQIAPTMKSGRANRCRDCQKEKRTTRYIAAPKIAKTADAKVRAGRERYRKNHPEKIAAHRVVEGKLRRGKLTRKPCEVCGSEDRLNAHHDDYSKPLDIRWLCRLHHVQLHREMEPA